MRRLRWFGALVRRGGTLSWAVVEVERERPVLSTGSRWWLLSRFTRRD